MFQVSKRAGCQSSCRARIDQKQATGALVRTRLTTTAHVKFGYPSSLDECIVEVSCTKTGDEVEIRWSRGTWRCCRAVVAAPPSSGCTPAWSAWPGSAPHAAARAGHGGCPPGPARRPPRHRVHPRRGVRVDRPIRVPEPVNVHMVQQRGEPCLLVSYCHLPHTVQRTGRVLPGPVSGTRFAGRVPLGRSPFLHCHRSRNSPGVFVT